MKRLFTAWGIAIIVVTLLAGAALAADESLKKLTGGGITVSYPPGMESQAKIVMEVATTSYAPSIDVHRQITALLSDVDAMGATISNLLSAPEKQDDAAARLRGYRNRSRALVQCFSNIRLFKKADAIATDGIDAGLLQVRYVKENDEFKMALELTNIDEDSLKRTYFPVLINADGSIRSEGKLSDLALDFLGAGKGLIIAPVHETVSYIVVQELKLFSPFSRWFTDGVSGYVARRAITTADPKMANLVQEFMDVSPKSKELRNKVNLLAWPQKAYQNLQPTHFDPQLEAAQTQYAIELVSELLGKSGAQTLPRIMTDLNYNANADTDTICAAIRKATGQDAMAKLLEYVPADIRKGIASNQARNLIADAKKLAVEKKWKEAVDKLRLALQMTPQDTNARLNLAWLDREVNENVDGEIQVFLVSRLLGNGDHSFSLYTGTVEGNYILGRLAILMGNVEYAKKFMESVLALKPDHKDAKDAMDAIKTVEQATMPRQ